MLSFLLQQTFLNLLIIIVEACRKRKKYFYVFQEN